MLIHHCTNIESLALILKSKKIRFNRLDRMDDLEEGRVEAQGIPVAKYTYVSCWTEDEEESIPLWNMYSGKDMGVRISLPQDMFKDYSFIDGLSGLNVSDILRVIDPDNAPIMLWKIPGSEYKGKNYLIIPVESDKLATFYRRIMYVDDVISLTRELALMVEKEEDSYYNFDLGNVGVLKNKRWSFQKESRFILRIIPTECELTLFDASHFMEHLVNALSIGLPPHFETYDLTLKDNIFNELEVTLSPSIKVGQRVIVEALLNQYAPKAKIKESSLTQLVQIK